MSYCVLFAFLGQKRKSTRTVRFSGQKPKEYIMGHNGTSYFTGGGTTTGEPSDPIRNTDDIMRNTSHNAAQCENTARGHRGTSWTDSTILDHPRRSCGKPGGCTNPWFHPDPGAVFDGPWVLPEEKTRAMARNRVYQPDTYHGGNEISTIKQTGVVS